MVITIIGVVILAIFYSIPLLKQAHETTEAYKVAMKYTTEKPFKPSDYYDRTQQQQESLLLEKENQEPYVIILWWGLDGLRLNDDGSFEWIRKRKKPVSVSYQPQQTINKEIYELEEKIRNFPKNTQSLPDEYWIMIHTLSELYKCQQIQDSLTKCCCEEYGLPKV